jgi:hypothetical protein
VKRKRDHRCQHRPTATDLKRKGSAIFQREMEYISDNPQKIGNPFSSTSGTARSVENSRAGRQTITAPA